MVSIQFENWWEWNTKSSGIATAFMYFEYYIRTIHRPNFLPPALSIQCSSFSILILFSTVLLDLPLLATNVAVVASESSVIKSSMMCKVLSSPLSSSLCLLLSLLSCVIGSMAFCKPSLQGISIRKYERSSSVSIRAGSEPFLRNSSWIVGILVARPSDKSSSLKKTSM